MLNFVIAMQVIEIWGILPNAVCGSARSNELMDPQFTDYFPSETEGAQSESESESEDGDIDRILRVSGTEIPWFNHQSVENNSILFWVGRKFPKLALYFAFRGDEAHDMIRIDCPVYISINGCKKRECDFVSSGEYENNLLYLYSPPQGFLQQNLNESNPTDQNYVEITYETQIESANVIRWGVHVECICPPQESGIPNLPLLTAGHDDYWSELPFYGSDDLEAEEDEEYQSPA